MIVICATVGGQSLGHAPADPDAFLRLLQQCADVKHDVFAAGVRYDLAVALEGHQQRQLRLAVGVCPQGLGARSGERFTRGLLGQLTQPARNRSRERLDAAREALRRARPARPRWRTSDRRGRSRAGRRRRGPPAAGCWSASSCRCSEAACSPTPARIAANTSTDASTTSARAQPRRRGRAAVKGPVIATTPLVESLTVRPARLLRIVQFV